MIKSRRFSPSFLHAFLLRHMDCNLKPLKLLLFSRVLFSLPDLSLSSCISFCRLSILTFYSQPRTRVAESLLCFAFLMLTTLTSRAGVLILSGLPSILVFSFGHGRLPPFPVPKCEILSKRTPEPNFSVGSSARFSRFLFVLQPRLRSNNFHNP